MRWSKLRILNRVIHWISFAVVMLTAALGVLYELMPYPYWEKLVGKLGLPGDGIAFGWIVGGCGIAFFALTEWLERLAERRDPKPRSCSEMEEEK